jgi:hypothetical protein
MFNKSITTPVFNYRKKIKQGNCFPVSFLAGCQLFEDELRQPELKIFKEGTLNSSASEEILEDERIQAISWLNSQNYNYFVIDPDVKDPCWGKAKKVIHSYPDTENSPYSTEDILKIANDGYCMIVSTIYIPKQEGHAILVYKNTGVIIVVRDPLNEETWDNEQKFEDVFEEKYHLGNAKLVEKLNEGNKHKAQNRYLIAFKLESSIPASSK